MLLWLFDEQMTQKISQVLLFSWRLDDLLVSEEQDMPLGFIVRTLLQEEMLYKSALFVDFIPYLSNFTFFS
jgi:hypothetical protein